MSNERLTPWVEKYRPKTMDEVAEQEQVIRVLKRTLESNNMPHLLFYGPPGTGKTSTVLALARDIFGADLARRRVLELNASDERGIKVVREKIKMFAQGAVSSDATHNGRPCPPYKLIILDEADSMTVDAQAALRRTMETYSKTTRFAIICNYVSRIIEPLASRCAKFRFRPLDAAVSRARLEMICAAEGVSVDSDALEALLTACEGDLRRAIMCLQSGAAMVGAGAVLARGNIREIVGVIDEARVERLVETIRGAGGWDRLEKEVKDIVLDGLSVNQLLHQLYEVLLNDAALTNEERSSVAQRIASAEKALVDGADEHLQLLGLATFWRQGVIAK